MKLKKQIVQMVEEAVESERRFTGDVLNGGVTGLSISGMRQYLEFIADRRFQMLEIPVHFGAKTHLHLWICRTVRELDNFCKRRVCIYQVAVAGKISFDESF